MSFGNSAGVYPRIIDRSFTVSGGGVSAGGVVITSPSGPLEPTYITSGQDFIDTYGLPSKDNPSMYAALRFINRAAALTVVRVINDATAATGVLDDGGSPATPIMNFTALSPGAWGNKLSIGFGLLAGDDEDSNQFVLTVSLDGNEVERFEVSRDPEAKNGFGTTLYVEEVVNRRSNYIRVEDDPSFAVGGTWNKNQTVTFSNGADDTSVASEGDIIRAYERMGNTDEVEAQILINAGWATPAVQKAMDSVAAQRDDAVAILDVPMDFRTSPDDMVEYQNVDLKLDSHLSGLYGGWVKVYDKFNDRNVDIPPSGDVAANFVETFEDAERWDAPAGMRRGVIPNSLGVTRIFNERERDLLYNNRINPVTTYAGSSSIIWGQKTLQKAQSALTRFNVVNSVLYIQDRVSESLKPFVFEPNTQFTRDNIEFLIDSFLGNIQTRGGLYDYLVDLSKNTPAVIDRNELIVEVRLQPVRAAEFIRLNIIVDRTGISYGG